MFVKERPVLNESQAVTVKFGLTLQQIMDVVRLYRFWQDSLTIKYTDMFPKICELLSFSKKKTGQVSQPII